jgi:para-aminobenzoate synthetase component 1
MLDRYRHHVPAPTVRSLLRQLPAADGCAVVRDGAQIIVAVAPEEVLSARNEQAFELLRDIASSGFWCGFCSYDLGRTVERVRERTVDDLGLPDVAFARYGARATFAGGHTRLEGSGAARAILEAALERASWLDCEPHDRVPTAWYSSLDEHAHALAVEDIRARLRAGECYQVNLTRRLTCDRALDPIALYTALESTNPAPYAGLHFFGPALPGLAIVSASPELFLRVDGRDVETRPIKGTARDAAVLAGSAKDRAENVMIVDLARNDLGRVCEFGSIQAPVLCDVEEHPGLYHLVSHIRGRLRDGCDLADLVRATFPPASVTGAPKPRVLQVIEDLEPVRRGVYCGALGWIDGDTGRAELAVAIRTFTIAGGRTFLGVGGGIVADSHADSEWAETELKAARLLEAAGAANRVPVR